MGLRQVWRLVANRIKPADSPEVDAFYKELFSLRRELREDHQRIETRILDMIDEIRSKQ